MIFILGEMGNNCKERREFCGPSIITFLGFGGG